MMISQPKNLVDLFIAPQLPLALLCRSSSRDPLLPRHREDSPLTMTHRPLMRPLHEVCRAALEPFLG